METYWWLAYLKFKYLILKHNSDKDVWHEYHMRLIDIFTALSLLYQNRYGIVQHTVIVDGWC